jgi:DNA primase large subunit
MFGNLPSSSFDVHIAYNASALAGSEGKLGNYDLFDDQTSKTMANENEGSLRMFLKTSAGVASLAARRKEILFYRAHF